MTSAEQPSEYTEQEVARLQAIWGEGFLSPGGAAEVGRIVGGLRVTNATVLDIGSGAGGADVVLVRAHGAARVVGIDVDADLVALATRRAAQLTIADLVSYRLVEPGPLPFPDRSFDVVFSKDAILHVRDKDELYRDVFRVLRPGGRLMVGDWFRGDDEALSPLVQLFVDAAGHDFTMASLSEIGTTVERAGFTEVDLADRRDWYLAEATGELGRLRDGPLRAGFVQRWGEQATQDEIDFWQVMVDSLASGAVRPGHVRAVKPR